MITLPEYFRLTFVAADDRRLICGGELTNNEV